MLVVVLVAVFALWSTGATSIDSPWITNSFAFTWTPSGANVSIPTASQCDSLPIKWSSANNAQAPDPVPPFYLRIYTSTLTYPVVVNAGIYSEFNYTVPFELDTQFQICMVDSQGNSGGCQESYTVVPRPSNSTGPANCTAPVPPPPKTLDVAGAAHYGPLTQFGWPDQCTDLSLMATNGQPPFVMTIAPSYHPPLNLTFDNHGPMNWTITLGWAMQFFISLSDASGATWAYGPMHVGGNGDTSCLVFAGNSLALPPPASASSRLSPGATAGLAVACVIAGALFTLLFQYILACLRPPRSPSSHEDGAEHSDEPKPRPRSRPSLLKFGSMRRLTDPDPYPIEAARAQAQSPPPPPATTAADSEVLSTTGTSQTDGQAPQHVYVVHHDAGGPPVTVFTGGRDVTELPPSYDPSRTSRERNATQPHARNRSSGTFSPKLSLRSLSS